MGTSEFDYGFGLTVDSSDNIYVTGRSEGELDGNTHSGNADIILIKYNSSGVKQWTKQLGTSSDDYAEGVTLDSSDNIYLTGYTWGDLDGNTSSGERDLFLIKYNSSGTKQWTKQTGTSSSDMGWEVTTDSSNNIYITGSTTGGLSGSNSGNQDLFLMKYNSSGTKQWTQQLGSSDHDLGYGVSTDSSDNIYVTGWTSGRLDDNTNITGNDIILLKYNSSGTKQWSKQLGSSEGDVSEDVIVDSSDNIYITGDTSGNLDGNTSEGGSDIFILKFKANGERP